MSQQWQGTGRLTRDATYEEAGSSGKKVAKFGLAINGYKDKVNFFECTAWEKQGGEVISKYTKKGDRISLYGEIDQERWDDKDGNKRSKHFVNVRSVELLEPKPAEESVPAATTADIPF
tara:strand:- start:229 stop:585 length:357 start_codon:yes stop_codon:yes gene_type:complete